MPDVWKVESRGSIFLPQIGWHLDARFPTPRAFVSHAHFDHLGRHREVLCSPATARLMAERMPGAPILHTPAFGETIDLQPGVTASLHPAGHILGSAMLRLEHPARGSLLYTGDFKLRPGLSAEPCQPPRADVLIMETTYGLPRYRLPPTARVLDDLVAFCQEAVAEGVIPVLFGYSLGKSQELLRALAAAGLPIRLHPQVARLTRVCAALGVEFPPVDDYHEGEAAGSVVICPPQSSHSAWLRKIRPRHTAAVTGWALDPNARFRFGCDALFPLSDHADFDDLIRLVEIVRPRLVWTVHGFAEAFAATLRANGVEAWALGRENQLELGLPTPAPSPELSQITPPPSPQPAAHDAFATLAATAAAVAATASRNRKVALLAETLASLSDEAIGPAAVFFSGLPWPRSEHLTLNLDWALIKRALLAASGRTEDTFSDAYRRFRDSGETAEGLLLDRTRPQPWTVPEAAAFFRQLASERSPAGKIDLLADRFRQITAAEARMVVRILTGDLRIGLKESLVEEALAAACGSPADVVREANLRSGDLARTALAARKGKLESIRLTLFHPLRFMLASPEPTAEGVVRRLGERVWLEDKFDGIRCQLHFDGVRAELFSRDLHRITDQFPEITTAAANLARPCILDGELLAWKDGRPLPFDQLQRRLGRRGDDFFLGQEIPVSLCAYDLLWLGGRDLLEQPLHDRRSLLEDLGLADPFRLAPRYQVSGAEAIDQAFLQARARGHEGLMAKDPASPYTPGRRGLAWLKLKKAFATLDVVVTAVEYGHGKRRDVLSDYTFSVRDDDSGLLRSVGKAYTGLTDAEIATLTTHFLQTTLEERGRLRFVRPEVVLEVGFDTIRPSRRHESGFALRFPRILRIRDDKTPEEIDTVDHCRRLAAAASGG